ncbi:transpeptidase [Nocardiopsis terrae]|uniref:Lipoprotein-anchoring transpeptidase ErfK/SrfK n=1 Tax=Nocardiopsis terrae TaxID=372655 RepID=A0ABR9HP01_9ACTN|nr:Ig-like domain-containing protein [Nocardiopsis terrae]MBE1460742.1 lipoprotein-anchoring transpeptidase ErfK/SrfK [Nocardiopsis terrae]GHC73212.1 transpeptidase [Nocardiopsis terrae]
MFRFPRTAVRRYGIGAAALALATAACTPTEAEPQATTGGGDVSISVTPEAGTSEVVPNTPVRVSAEGGTITEVRVDQDVSAEAGSEDPALGEMTGTLGEDGADWVSDWNLRPGAQVTVTAVAEGEDGTETEEVAEFTTLAAGAEQGLDLASNFPNSGQTAGVGMPVIVDFTQPVTNQVQVENSMEVTSEHPVPGSWRWLSETRAVFRPEEYWEPYQTVTVDMHLAGVEASEGVYGLRDYRLEFEVGRELIATMHVPDHEMVISVDGEQQRTIPVSNGAATTDFNTTTSGSHVLMSHHEREEMDSSTTAIPDGLPGYSTVVSYAVRTTNSGEYVHEASGNPDIGTANTSNGCTNLRMDDALWFFENTLRGDVLETTGTDRQVEWDNGWSYFQLEFDEWLAESATGEPQLTDGNGTPGPVHGEGL